MSHTYRKKDSWNKYQFVDAWVEDEEWFKFLTGERVVWGGSRNGKYHGCTKEQVLAKLNAWWHGETNRNWNDSKRIKQYSRWKLRAKNKQELTRAMQTGEEENLMLTTCREIKGEWWFYN